MNRKLQHTDAVGKRCVALFLTGCMALTTFGDTLTWTGAATGNDKTNFLAAANWSPAQAPQGGDTLIMNTAVTLAPGEFDFGASGITISNSAAVSFSTTFKGSGKLVKGGAGQFKNNHVCRHTGGTLVLDGELYQNARYENNKNGTQTQYPLGTGQVEIRRSATTAPKLNLQNYCNVYSPILVSGPYTANQQTFFENNNPNVYAKVTAEDDFLAYCSWSNGTTAGAGFRGGIDAHGHTAYISNSGAFATTLAGEIDASVTTSKGYVYITDGGGTDPAAVLSVGEGRCLMKTTGYWRGTNVNLTASGSILQLSAVDNLPEYAELTLASGAKVDFANAAAVSIAKLTVNGEVKPDGIYNSASTGGFITGGGSLFVGNVVVPHEPQRITWTGSAGNYKWNTAGNWSPALVPTAGDTAVFNADVAADENRAVEAVPLPAGTLTIEVASGKTFNSYVAFSGAGAVVKTGAGQWCCRKGSLYTGGTTIERGSIGLRANNALGSGDVTLDLNKGYQPVLNALSWDPVFPNKIVIRGSTATYNAIICSNRFDIDGAIESESDFTMSTSYGPLSPLGGVSAPGHTMTYNGASGYSDGITSLEGTFDVSLVVKGNYKRTLACKGVGLDNKLEFQVGASNVLSSAFSWEGTNVVISGSSTRVHLNGVGNFSADAEVRLSNGAKLVFDSAVNVNAKRLFVDGQEVPSGIYTAADLPDVFVAGAAGKIYVGYAISRWTGGGVSGEWSDPDNWSTHRVPGAGDVAYFPGNQTVTNRAGKVALDGDLVIESNSDITWRAVLTGSGKVIKGGTGKFCIRGTKLEHTGGIRVENGILQMDNVSALGTGPIWLVRTGTLKPQFDLSQAGTGLILTNQFFILGPKSASYDILVNNDDQLKGKITAEDDFRVSSCWSNNNYAGTYFWSEIDAPGHTVTFSGNYGFILKCKVNCSVSIAAAVSDWYYTLEAGFSSTDPEATLTTAKKTVVKDGIEWPGTLVVATGGTISVPANGKAKVGVLKVGDNVQPAGIYTKTSAPQGATFTPGSVFVGDGRLQVGVPGLTLIFR